MERTNLREELHCAWLITKWARERLLTFTAFVAATYVWLSIAAVTR